MSCSNVIVNFETFAKFCEVDQINAISKCLKKKSLKGVIEDFINLKFVSGIAYDVLEIITLLEVALKYKATDNIILDELIRKSFFLFAYIY